MFIQIMQGHCSDQDRMRALGDRWRKELAPDAPGWLGGTFGFTDDGVFVAVVRFDSRQAAEASSARPEQTAWWKEAETCFDGPVQFHDCDDVTLMMDGGSDDARFVQIIQGKVDDPERLKAMMTDTDMIREQRPDILGGTLAIEPDGTFTETVAFVDEESARRGEQAERPEESEQDWESVIHDVSYLDLHQPWFASRR